MRPSAALPALLGLIASLAGAAPATAPLPAPVTSAVLGPGESFGFQARWGTFPRAGRIDVSADDATAENERRVTVRIASDGTIGRLYRYEAIGETLFATDTGLMQSASYHARAGRKVERREMVFDHDAHVARYRDVLEPKRDTTLALPLDEQALDLVTTLVTARRWHLAAGDTREILVLVDHELYPLRLKAGAVEPLRTSRGKFSALVVTPEPVGKPRGLFKRGGSLKIWLEDSPARLPLRVEVKGRFGTVTADLVQYSPPRDESS